MKIQNRIIVNGKDFPTNFPVVTWKDPGGYGFKSGFANRDEKATVDLFVLHWDVCRTSAQCHRALVQRTLSVHFLLDADGTVYQCLDLQRATAYHAAGVNARSVGVEICNQVAVAGQDPKNPRPEFNGPGLNGGKPFTHLDFFAAQKARAVALADAVCSALKIPKRIPKGAASKFANDPSGVPTGVISDLKKYKGVLGHYHVTTAKIDPGTTLWPEFKWR